MDYRIINDRMIRLHNLALRLEFHGAWSTARAVRTMLADELSRVEQQQVASRRFRR
jgi:hypothetical protein